MIGRALLVGVSMFYSIEYIAAGICCSQLLWMKKLLGDYGLSQEIMIVYYDNSSAIDISKNPV